jgi:hypothetical protein
MAKIMGRIFSIGHFRRLPMGLSAMREKYSDLYQALRVRDDEYMK